MGYKFEYIDCNICGSQNRTFLGKRIPRSFTLDRTFIPDIVKCRDCGLFYPYPMPVPDNEQLLKNYGDPDTYFPTKISEGRLKFYGSILRRINNKAGGKGKLLDIGCGRGELVYAAKNYGWEAYGVDASPSFAKYARDRFNVDVKVGDLRGLNFESKSFDVVSLIASLDHIYDPKTLVLESNRILKKRGFIFIEIMNNDSILYKLGDLYYRLKGKNITTRLSPTFPSFQIYGFSVKSIFRLMEISGFEILDIRIKGGFNKTERAEGSNVGDRLLRLARLLCLGLADLVNKGQVLTVYARKKEKVGL